MRYNPDNMPLHKSGSICGYLIWRANQINAAIDKYDNISNEKVYLGWSNPNYNRKNKWYSLSHLKFDYFQEISQSNCFVGISLDKLGNKKYRIFKPRISNLKKEFDVVTYPAISGETYWDFEWLPDARVFKVYKLSGDCAILIPPRWKQCNNVPFNDIDYDPYSLFRYWPNTEFGHFKDFVFTNDILFGENYNGTLDVISSKGEIISILWSDLKITCDGISFRNRNNIQENVDFSDIETYHNRELSEMSESLNPSFESDTHILGNTEMDGPATQNVPLPVIVDDGEDIRWIYKNFEIQYDGKTIHFKNTNNRIRPENLILCVGRRASENNAYIVRYGGRNVRFHLIERKFELPSEVSALRNRLKTGELPIPMHYLPKMSDDELIESFKAINSNFDSIGTNKKETDFCIKNTITNDMMNVDESSNVFASELKGKDFAEMIMKVYKYLSMSFPLDKVFQCLLFLFGDNIRNIKGYNAEIDSLIESEESDYLSKELEKMVETKIGKFLSDRQAERFMISLNYHIKILLRPYMESLDIALKDTKNCDNFIRYIEEAKIFLKRNEIEANSHLNSMILKTILGINDDVISTAVKYIKPIELNNHIYRIGDMVSEEILLGNRRQRRFIRAGDCLLIILSKTECYNNMYYRIKGEGESGNQIKGQNANGDIVDSAKRKIIIIRDSENGVCKIHDEVIYVSEEELTEETNNNKRTVFYFSLKSICQ